MIGVGGLLALTLSAAGAFFLRVWIARRIEAIRDAARDIERGNLGRRLPVSGGSGQFARLNQDLNRMLDKVEQRMDGARHVSNTIAHSLRTPLGRIRAHLDETLHARSDAVALAAAGDIAVQEVDGLIALLDKLLQMAETESGARRQTFEPVAMRDMVANVVERYQAAAHEMAVALVMEIEGNPSIRGDRQLLESVLTDLLDNALKYAGHPTAIGVYAAQRGDEVILLVHDDGLGIPVQERTNVLQRFYRLNHEQQGNGIGLSTVAAIVSLHGGTLHLEDAAPGLLVRMVFPGSASAV